MADVRREDAMSGMQRSRTAQGVAAERAVLTDMGVLDDHFARGMLTPGWAAFAVVVRRTPERVRPWSVTRAGLAARVLWFDAQVASALDAGVEQVVVIGAGYDSRAWRFRGNGTRFFEVDHPTTQHDKMRRAPGPGPTYVPRR
jgi:methyltransferase (TIGR00027 family)